MENMAEALKIAFAVMMFILALTLSMSSFSQARRAVNEITTVRDRDAEWSGNIDYVTPSKEFSRIVGIETVITSIYRAYEENIEIYFFENDETTPISLYYEIINGEKTGREIATIDAANPPVLADKQAQKDFLDIILGGNNALNNKEQTVQNAYKDCILYWNGLYDELKDFEFEERLGEYKQGTDSNALTKRVVTYIKQP